MARALDGFDKARAKVLTKVLLNALVRLISNFQPRLRMFYHHLGQRRDVDHRKSSQILMFHLLLTPQTLPIAPTA